MLGSDTLEIALGLIFIFLILSLLATTLREQVELIFKTRAVHLERGIRTLLSDPDGGGVVQLLYEHPLVSGLFDGDHRPGSLRRFKTRLLSGKAPPGNAKARFVGSSLPSYIPSRNVAMALLDLTAKVGGRVDGAELDLEAVRATATTLANTTLARALLIAVDEAKGDVDRARASLEAWYDSGMDRVSGWYKRESQWILLAIGLVLAVGLNVDAIRVTRELAQNASLRHAVVTYAEANHARLAAAVDRGAQAPTTTAPALGEPATDTAMTVAGLPSAAATLQDESRALANDLGTFGGAIGWGHLASDWTAEKVRLVDSVRTIKAPVDEQRRKKARVKLSKMDRSDRAELEASFSTLSAQGRDLLAQRIALIERWPSRSNFYSHAFWTRAPQSTLGWLLTALAVMMGAPFWFDLLNKFMVIRSTVKPFEKSPNEGSEDRRGGMPPAIQLAPVGPAPLVPVGPAPVVASGPSIVTLRLAVEDFDELTPGTAKLLVNGLAIAVPSDGLIELPLEIGRPQQLSFQAGRNGRAVSWEEGFVPTVLDEARPLTLALQ